MALSFGKRENEAPPAPARPLGAAPAASSIQPLGTHAAAAQTQAAADNGARLTVGANIKLKGVEITDCDTLAVEGTVEATINARVIQSPLIPLLGILHLGRRFTYKPLHLHTTSGGL